MSVFTPLDHDPKEIATCGNCGHECRSEECHPIYDPCQRLSAGSPVPAGECPECGSLSYVRNHATPTDIPQHIALIWEKLHAYQEGMIPFDKYEEQLRDFGYNDGSDSTYASIQETADQYREEWDAICLAMARITEEFGLTAKETS